MYYYEFQINGVNKLFKSQFKYQRENLNNIIMNFTNAYDKYELDFMFNLLSYLSTHYGILPYYPKVHYEFDINLDYYYNLKCGGNLNG